MANEPESTDERIFELGIPEDKQTDALLVELAKAILLGLRAKFPAPYETAREENEKTDDRLEVELSLRKGLPIGVSIKLLRDDEKPGTVGFGIEPSTKLAQYVTLGVTVPLMIACGVMGMGHIAPLDFLPGRRIAALLGALIGFVCALPIFMTLNYLLGRGSAPQNRQLVNEVATCVEEIALHYFATATAPPASATRSDTSDTSG